MTENLRIDREAVSAFCRRHDIARLALFGSVLRDDVRPDSDVDVLVYVCHMLDMVVHDHLGVDEDIVSRETILAAPSGSDEEAASDRDGRSLGMGSRTAAVSPARRRRRAQAALDRPAWRSLERGTMAARAHMLSEGTGAGGRTPITTRSVP